MGALTWLAALATVGALYLGATVLIPPIVSFFVLIVLEPLVARLERGGLKRTLGASAAVLLFMIATGLAVFLCARALAGIAQNVPKYSQKLRATAQRFERFERHANTLQGGDENPSAKAATPSDVQKVQVVRPAQETWGPLLWRGLGGALEALGLALFVPFLALFGLISKRELLDATEKVLSPYFDVSRASDEIPRMVRAFFLGNFVVGLAAAAISWASFAGLGLSNAAGIGLVSGFVNLIPILGLPLALGLPIAQGLLQFDNAAPFVLILAIVGGLHLFIGNLVMPRVIGARVQLNAAAATLGMLFWWWVWGIVGFVFAIPLTALFKIALECRAKTEPASKLLAATRREELRKH